MAAEDMSPLLTDGDVSLREHRQEDVELLARWGADPEFARYQWASEPWVDPPVLAARFLERFAAMHRSQGQLYMVDVASYGGTIGYINYRDVRPKVRSCEVGIAIGDRALWSHGYGTRAMQMLLYYLFSALNLHKITLRVVAFNTAAIRSYEQCGFRREGLLRDAHWLDNRWWDSLLMAVLEDEWAALLVPSTPPAVETP